MEPEEMPEFKHPSIRLEKEDWACLHCWTSNAVPYTDESWASLKIHLKEKCVQPPMPLLISATNIWDA